MYSKEQIKKLQSETNDFLKKTSSGGQLKPSNIKELRNVLRFHDHRYYVMNDPLISDFEYDQLYKQLEKLEKENPELVSADSPTQRVAKGLTKDFPTVQHMVPMLSLSNSYNDQDVIDFDRRARELTGEKQIEYCVEPKFDGASISLIYENDMLVRAATRGDGVEGDEITTNIKQIKSIPLSADFSSHGIQLIEIRGEVMINKNNFKKYNEKLAEFGLTPLANPRNAASGTLRIKDPSEVKKRSLEAYVYHVSYFTKAKGVKKEIEELSTHSASLKFLWQLGFRSPLHDMKVIKGIDQVIKFCGKYEIKRDELPYEIDGMVIKVNEVELQDKMGMTTHHPRWALAFKFKARQATSKLLGVEYQVGRTGAVTPVAKLEPVSVGGVTVSSISIHNEDYIKEKDLRIGDAVLIERAGDVIPQIVKSLPEVRSGKEKKIHFPDHCPVCKSRLFKEEEEAVWRCINIECPAQVVERIIHFVSKDAMDIRGFGEANVTKFYELGLLKDIPGIYRLDFGKIGKLEGFGGKSIANLQQAIEKSKNQPLNRLIYALGIRFVGETTAKTLANSVENVMDLQLFTLDELQNLEDIGPRVGGSIFEFFKNKANISMLKELKELGINLNNRKKEAVGSGNLKEQTFLFTGTLPTLKRSEAEEMVEQHGGQLLSGVSSKLDYLVVGEDAGSKLEKAKKINTIKIISEADFLKLIGKN